MAEVEIDFSEIINSIDDLKGSIDSINSNLSNRIKETQDDVNENMDLLDVVSSNINSSVTAISTQAETVNIASANINNSAEQISNSVEQLPLIRAIVENVNDDISSLMLKFEEFNNKLNVMDVKIDSVLSTLNGGIDTDVDEFQE
jgi:methyl-accepting chemotaxis protein